MNGSKEKKSIPIKKALALFVVAFVAGLAVFFDHFSETPLEVAQVRESGNHKEYKPAVGYLAPAFTVRNLEGNREGLSNHQGKVVILNFWATWCAPCRVEMPAFETLYRRYRSEGLTVLAVSIDNNAEQEIRRFVDKYNLSFPVLMDTKGKAERLYPSPTIPFTYVIDRSGRVVARVDGAKNWESRETFEAVEHLLKQS